MSTGACCGHLDGLGIRIRLTRYVEGLGTRQFERFGILAVEELQRQHAHADQVRTVNALEALCDYGFDAEQYGSFRGPVT